MGTSAAPGGWTDSSGALDPGCQLQDFSHRALVGLNQEWSVQTHLLMHSFMLCNTQALGEEKGQELGRRMWIGHAMVGVERLQKYLGIEGDDIEAVANIAKEAGIPLVMQAMLKSLEGKLRCGPVVRSVSVTAYLGESQIASELGDIQARHPDVDLGSYPFFRNDRYGTSLVIRGTDESELEDVLEEVKAAIVSEGETPQDVHRA